MVKARRSFRRVVDWTDEKYKRLDCLAATPSKNKYPPGKLSSSRFLAFFRDINLERNLSAPSSYRLT